MAGVLADRIDRRFLMGIANAANAASFAGIGVLVVLGEIEAWHVIVSSVVAGAAMALQQTGSIAVIPSLVPREGIMNAVSLHSITMGIDRVAGPLLSGLLIAGIGVEGAYFAAAAALVAPSVLYWFMRPLKIKSKGPKESFLNSFRAGMKFSLHNQTVLIVLLATAITVALGMPFLSLLPLYVTDVLHMGAISVGTLLALPGLLTVAGGLMAASMGDSKYKGVLLFISCAGPCLAAAMLGLVSTFWGAMVAMGVFSAAASQYGPSSRSAILKATPEEFQGRVSSLLVMTLGLSSAGIVINGVMSDLWGIQMTFLVFGPIALALNILLFVAMPAYRRIS
jgi:MFS family permease